MDAPNFADYKWESPLTWQYICRSEEIELDPETGNSAMFLAGDTQLAIFRFPDNRLFASQNMCGHRRAFVLSEGALETDDAGISYVSCPLHRRKFALEGENAGYTQSRSFRHTIATFEAKEEDGKIYLKLPNITEMDAVLGTQKWSTSGKREKPSFVRSIGGNGNLLRSNGGPSCAAIDSSLTW